MKKLIITSILALLFAFTGGSALMAQNGPEEYLGLPGDNLNLYAVMDLFQESETLEEFERAINDPERMINNLDLTGDNYVDYIFVHHYVDGDIHSIVLRVALNEYEYQDVAVFTVQQFADGSAQVQLIGDKALYGPDYIIEPIYAETPNPGYRGNVSTQVQAQPRHTTVVRTTYYEVAHWPVIVYISGHSYRPWRSAWHWGYYPTWWSPWTPHYWHFYYGYHYNWHSHYYAYYRPWSYYRCGWYHNYYLVSARRYSPTYVVWVNSGHHKHTYSRPESRREGEVLFAQRNSRGSTVGNRSITPAESHRARSGREDINASTREERAVSQPRGTDRAAAARSANESPAQATTGRQSNVNENARSGQPARTTTAPAPRQSSTPAARTAPASNSREERRQTPAVSPQQRNSGSSAVQNSRSNQRSSGSSAVQNSRSNQRSSGSSAVQNSRSNQRSSGSSAVQNSRSNQRNSGNSAAPNSRSNQRSNSRGSQR